MPNECHKIGARSPKDSRRLLSSSSAPSRVSGFVSCSTSWYFSCTARRDRVRTSSGRERESAGLGWSGVCTAARDNTRAHSPCRSVSPARRRWMQDACGTYRVARFNHGDRHRLSSSGGPAAAADPFTRSSLLAPALLACCCSRRRSHRGGYSASKVPPDPRPAA